MKSKKFKINGKSCNLFGAILYYSLIAVIVLSFVLIIGFTGGCELGMSTCTQYLAIVIPCLVFLILSVYLLVSVYFD